mgnify:FL=1|tara:strand:- start:1807 stop:3429 length:1623 start_codon:yes stop_codon:yes gene_type:complete
MYILSIHESHDASMALIKDGEVLINLSHERLSHIKHDRRINLFASKIKQYTNYVDKVVVSCLHNSIKEVDFPLYANYCGIDFGEIVDYSPFHHISHSYLAFKHSNFENAISVVLDGAGSEKPEVQYHGVSLKECESVYQINPHMTACIYKSYVGQRSENFEFPYEVGGIDRRIGIGMAYSGITEGLGYGENEDGKTMGLSAYASEEQINSIPKLVELTHGADGNKFKLFRAGALGYCSALIDIPKELHVEYAGRIQRDFEEYVIQLVHGIVQKTGCRNIVLSGGCFLNCVANFKLRKSLPPEFNIFVEPMSGDDGIALANAFMVDDMINPKNRKLNTLYLGSQLEYEYTLSDGESEVVTTPKEVAQLISEGNCIAIAQGRSESGPRALGNRSILFDPRDKDGKDKVNKIKKREYFRPFAATVLHENSQQWFDMNSLDESPYMTYAVDVLPDKSKTIPAVTHVNNTCRIQTLKQEQNKNYYELINEFYKLTDVPMVLNTSFNLAGDTMVETIEDALKTLRLSELEYLYLPETKKLIHVPNK